MTNRLPILTASDITIGYEDAPVIKGASFSIYDKDFIGIIGPNGGGKTTLMKAILGLIPPTTGHIEYFNAKGEISPSLEIGYVPQQNAIDKAFPISVSRVVGYGLMKAGKLHLSKEDQRQVAATLERVGMLEYSRKSIGELSGGQLQRVLLARAIVAMPTLLILDEPNTYVDKHFESQLYELLPEINKHSAILIVSHDVGAVCKMVKRLFCINRHLHIHENIDLSCDECNDSAPLRYLSLLEHK
ncbi:metal ABC transporter ATP-binding protein [Porphyromonas sp.]|uniref:metal ABC transporter ATP-binding protein n=1 Tax=Porphyromonas sp. TaxID=1924944 RepID=UPI0026DBFDDC|nr:ATP-binding cassette domain-containing protein [Porphyromonas sp.]MDO4695446.1 ATP-binding cassette domain-containing protein [Porphyromonas sp.]MDO4771239.1 ATP-binding cassette domain-containing protein [Porphyromonas sp.]